MSSLTAAAGNLADPNVSPRNITLGTISITNATATTVNIPTNLFATFGYMHDMSVFTIVNGGNNTNSTLAGTNYFDLLAPDGTNYTTTQPLSTIWKTGGTNTAVYCTVISKSSLEGCKAIRWTSSQTAPLGSGTNVNVTVELGITP